MSLVLFLVQVSARQTHIIIGIQHLRRWARL